MWVRTPGFLSPVLLLTLCATVGAGIYSENVINNTSPVIYWNQNETSGTTAADSAPLGGANNGTYGGTFTLGAAGPRPSDGFPTMAADNKAPSVAANGYTLYTTMTSGAGVATDSYSLQTWFNSTKDPLTDRVLQYVFTRGNGTSNGDRRDAVDIMGFYTPANSNKLELLNGDPAKDPIPGTTLLSPNTWYHMVFVRDDTDSTKAKVYLNGRLEIEDTDSWYGGTGEHLTVGHRTDYHSGYGGLGLWGKYDEAAVWDRPLTESEVQNLYFDAVGTPPYAAGVLRDSPEAYWRMNETTGNDTATDATGNGHDIAYYSPTYNDPPTRTGLPPDVGPRPAEFGGFEAANNAPTLPGDEHQPGNDDGFVIVPQNVLNSQNNYSAEMWFRRGSLSTHGAYLMHRNDLGNGNGGDYLGLWPDGRVFIYDGDSPGISGSTATAEGQWYHIGMSRDGDNVTVYLNGREEIATTTMAPWNEDWNGGTWTFGGRNDTGRDIGQEFPGNIDEIAVYGDVLSGDDFQENYLTAQVRRSSPYARGVLRDSPEAYWRLDETEPYDLAVDATGHGHTFDYHATPTRTGSGSDVGPGPEEFQGFDPGNNAPTLTGGPLGSGRTDDGYVGIATGVLAGTPGGLNNDYSAEMWFRRGDDPNSYGDYLMHRSDLGAPHGTGDFLGVSDYAGTDHFDLFVYSGDGSVPNRHGSTVLYKDQWYHVGMVRQGDDVRVYLNGQLEISTTMPSKAGADWSDGTWAFGGRSDMPTQQKFAGNIDEVAIHGGVLGELDFQENYLNACVRRDVHYAQTVLDDGPEAYWRLDEIEPYVLAADATGNGHTFQYHDEASRTGTGNDVGPRPDGLNLNGFTDLNNSPRLEGDPKVGYIGIAEDVLPGQNDYTAEMWFSRNGDQGPHGSIYLMHRNDLDGASRTGDFLGVLESNTTPGEYVLFGYNGNNPQIVWGSTPISIDDWYHVAMLREGDLVSIYLDGQLEAQGLMPLRSGTKFDDGVWTFGNRSDNFDNDQRFNGNIDEIAIYGRLLGPEEIMAHYLAANVPEPSTMLLSLFGLVGLAWLVRRGRKQQH